MRLSESKQLHCGSQNKKNPQRQAHPWLGRRQSETCSFCAGSAVHPDFDWDLIAHDPHMPCQFLCSQYQLLSIYLVESVKQEDQSYDALQVITASSDATVRIWDAKTCDCVQAFRPPQAGSGELAVNNAHLNPQNLGQILVCNDSSTAFLMTMQGQVSGLPRCSCSNAMYADFPWNCVCAREIVDWHKVVQGKGVPQIAGTSTALTVVQSNGSQQDQMHCAGSQNVPVW